MRFSCVCRLTLFRLSFLGLLDVWGGGHNVQRKFSFAKDIVSQDSKLFMASLDVDSLFTNIPVVESVKICVDSLFENCEKLQGLSKEEFHKLLTLATTESFFTFNGNCYKQIDGIRGTLMT